MTEKTKLTLLMVVVPWIFIILFGDGLYSVGLLLPAMIVVAGISLLNALIAREISDRDTPELAAPSGYANANGTPVVNVRVHNHTVDLKRLRAHQADSTKHPFTCGSGRRTDEFHLDGEGVLTPTPTGWTCPYCDYRQPYGDLERSI